MVNLFTKFKNLKSLGAPVMKLCMAVQNAENGAVRGHSRSWVMSPFDRVHTISYSASTETMWHFLYRFRDIASYLSKVAEVTS